MRFFAFILLLPNILGTAAAAVLGETTNGALRRQRGRNPRGHYRAEQVDARCQMPPNPPACVDNEEDLRQRVDDSVEFIIICKGATIEITNNDEIELPINTTIICEGYGTDDDGDCTIDADGRDKTSVRVFRMFRNQDFDYDEDVNFCGIDFQNFGTPLIAIIAEGGSTLFVSGCTFTNVLQGIEVIEGASLEIEDSTFTESSEYGIFTGSNSTLQATNCKFVENTDTPVVLSDKAASALLVGCEFIDNKKKKGSGGAMFISDALEVTLEACLFENNFALQQGGAIFVRQDDFDDEDTKLILKGDENEFINNKAAKGSHILVDSTHGEISGCGDTTFTNPGQDKGVQDENGSPAC